MQALERAGINLVSITDTLDTKTPIGKFVVGILANIAELERNMIAERTTAGIKAFKERGGVMGQPHPILDRPKRLAKFKSLHDRAADH